MKVYIEPMFRGEDQGDGGVRRVVDSQREYFPKYGATIVDSLEEADIAVIHITPYSQTQRWLYEHPEMPVVVDCHGLYWAEYDWGSYVGKWPEEANKDVMENIRRSDAVVCHSEWVAQAVRRHTMRQVEVIANSINPDEWSPGKNEGYVLWNKNRPDPVCDPAVVEALAESKPDLTFVTTFGPALPNVQITGALPFERAKKLIQNAGLYLCTTRETFGVGTLEAIAAGVPVVGFNWGGQREFLEHEKNAWLSTPGDITALGDGLWWALNRRSDLAHEAYKILPQFTHDRIAEQYVGFLQQVLERKSKLWKEQPRTTVLVTAYNLEAYLGECLDSVKMQIDQDWECVVVDDASPDKCGEIADKCAERDPRFTVVHNPENQYLAGARNTGMQVARGRYILPLDADDMLAPDAVKFLADALDKDRSSHIVYGNVLFVDQDGHTATNYQVRNQSPGHSGWPMDFRYEWQESQRNLLPYCSMYRREVHELTGGYRRRCRTAEDADFWTRAASYGFRPRMVTKHDTLIYRNRKGSMSREEGGRDWAGWFPWSKNPELRPAGALSEKQPPIHSVDPPIISVIIPVGPGHEKLLWDAIDSVDSQTFRQWECIVVNDTGEELSLPSWVKVLSTGGRERGVARARNVGIRASRGRFFIPLDADDYLQPAFMQAMFHSWMETNDPIMYSDWYQEFKDQEWNTYEAPDFDAHILIRSGCIHAVTALYQRDLFDELGGFDEALPAWEDWDFQIAAAAIGKCSTRVPHPLWVYRKDTGYRREENYDDFEGSKQGILAKWSPYFKTGSGRKELMACGGCAKRKAAQAATPAAAMSPSAPMQEAQQVEGGAVMVEYVGENTANQRFRAPSGTVYTFAGVGNNKQKFILQEDAKWFLGLRDFQEAAASTPIDDAGRLVAEGPPVR